MLMNTPSRLWDSDVSSRRWDSDMLVNIPSRMWCGIHNLMESPLDMGMDVESLGPDCQYA